MSYETQCQLIRTLRSFFEEKNFLEIFPTPVVPQPGIEVHIFPFEVHPTSSNTKSPSKLYLHTSPEFEMKKALAKTKKNLFTIGYAFRDEPSSPIHRHQFLMLEWYRANASLHYIKQDIQSLINKLKGEKQNFLELTTEEAFIKFCHINWKDFPLKKDFYNKIKESFPSLPLPREEDLTWEDCFHLLMLNEVEPHFREIPFLFLTEYPASMAALSTLKETDLTVCNRFEFFINGIEIGNCYQELTDLSLQQKRAHQQLQEKNETYHIHLPSPDELFSALKKGLPQSAGIAFGIERLHQALFPDTASFYTDFFTEETY